MPHIEIDRNHMTAINGIVEFVKLQMKEMPMKARCVLLLKLTKEFKHEMAELKRKNN